MSQNRQPKGVRTGGQFATDARSDDIDDLDEAPSMPDRPGGVGWREVSYSGQDGFQVRLPSRAAMLRFADEGQTEFEVPVRASMPGKPDVEDRVRVRRSANGAWEATPRRLTGVAGGMVSEATSAVLEAQRARHSVEEAGDLLIRHKAARAGRGETSEGHSGWIKDIGYAPDAQIMTMRTLTGRAYGYRVDPETYEQLHHSASRGADFNRLIRKKVPQVPVTECDHCGGVYATGLIHRCPR